MSAITFDSVQPLIASESVSGRTFQFTFRCPQSGEEVKGSHTIESAPAAAGQIASRVKRAAAFSLRGPIASAIRSAFGYSNPIGRLLGDVGSQVAYVATTPTAQGSAMAFSPEQKREAAVEAFRQVAGKFAWSPQGPGWVAAKAAGELSSPFERQLSEFPIQSPYDREVAARMLVEVALSDGELARSEASFLSEFIDPEIGEVASLSARPPLTGAELAETGAEVRETLVMLAWLLALADEEFEDAEAARLEFFEQGLSVAADNAKRARNKARGFLFDQTLGNMLDAGEYQSENRERLMDYAARLGMDRAEAESCEARFQKRRGLSG